MYRRPDLASALWMILALFLLSPGTLAASGRGSDRVKDFALGSIHSPKGVGLCADLDHESGAFDSFSLTADLIDILDGKSSTPGVKATYHHNLVLKDWAEGKYELYAGPGIALGRVRDMHNHFGMMAGLSGDAGLRVHCFHSIMVSLEWQVDFALQFKNRFNPDMSLYSAGFRHSYYPHLRLQYCF